MNRQTKQKFLKAKRENLIRKYPTWTEEDLQSFNFYSKTDNSANALTRCIMDWITFNGGQAERINTMGRRVDNRKTITDVMGYSRTVGSIEWQKGTGTKGSSDISATIPMQINGMRIGVSVKIEVKFGKDRQSKDQKEYEKSINNVGGIYYTAKNIDDFVEWYEYTFTQGKLMM
jgi:hypothetical protein